MLIYLVILGSGRPQRTKVAAAIVRICKGAWLKRV